VTPSGAAPAIGESDLFDIRGLQAGKVIAIGPESTVADTTGRARISLRDCETLRGHIGLIEVRADGVLLGEIEVTPDKLSLDRYVRLRNDLEAVWSGLVFDPLGTSRVRAGLPRAWELVRRIERELHAIAEMPRETVVAGVQAKHLHVVRRRSELTRSVIHGASLGRPGLARVPIRSSDTPENAMVAATVRKLAAYARRTGDTETEARLLRVLSSSHLSAHTRTPKQVSWGMRSDPAYRRVLEVHRMLERPELGATEGPGDLRLGVRGLSRLYEYWVYLQVLLAAKERYGPPIGPGFSVTARRLRDGRARLELLPGTTVTFPGPVHVAFEPILVDGQSSWMDVRYVPHPDPDRAQTVATPDVVIYHPGSPSWLVVIDAKYVARAWVERAAADLHAKYSRMIADGRPIARFVLAAHPHAGFERRWAGYGHVPMAPGLPRPALPLLDRRLPARRSSVVLIADQGWMNRRVGDRRIDLAALRHVGGSDRTVAAAHLVLPHLQGLATFAHAAEVRGWLVHEVASTNRSLLIEEIARIAADVSDDHDVVVITGDPDVVGAVRAAHPGVEIFVDLDSVPALAS
jgi:hypothetical protein